MPIFFQKPENALKRAKESIAVGKKQQALDALYDVIKSKKHRTWQKIHEPIMEKYLELCVELKKSHVAKEGLYQYKNICQQMNIRSLEEVVRKYLAMAEEKTEAARQESHQAVIDDVDDLDIIQTPENMLLSAVSGEDTQDRTDRAILTPWVKFLWESYRQCLDLLRNNNSVERLYQDIAQNAFKFCLKYTRKTEFRKLCENLRMHLGHVYKHQNQQRAINLNNPESQAMHLETRLAQLDSAIQMELWQEAFKAVEDIHGLITLAKKHPKPALMANYYQKLGLVFWKSGNKLFHACAWHRLFHLSREQRRNLSQDELQKLASRVLCATLAINIPPARNQIDQVLDMDESTAEKQRRLATLLGLQNPPNRSSLVKDLVRYNMVQYVHPELQNLYHWLEVEFHPLKLSARVTKPLEFIGNKEDLSQYVHALQDITIMRLLKQVSQVYQTISFERMLVLAPFTSTFHLERIVVDAAKNLDLQIRINHATRSLSFGTDLGVAQREDAPEGPYLQAMPSECIRNQMINMAHALDKAVTIIRPNDLEIKLKELNERIVTVYRQTARREHQNILMRRQIIEDRKEELENINVEREMNEQQLLAEQQQSQYEAEKLRLEREATERERQRIEDEQRDIKRKATKERLEQLKSTPIGAKMFADMDEEEMADMNMDEIMAKQLEQMEKEKREMQEKLRQQEKRVDYIERAKRTEEVALLTNQYEEEKVQDKEYWMVQEEQRIELLKKEREKALEHSARLCRMTEDKDAFLNKLKGARTSVYKDKLAEFEKKLKEERKKKLAERKEKRKEDRRAKWLEEKEEEEQRKRDEEIKRQHEEEERLAGEEKAQRKAEYEEELRKLNEIEERQRAKEREMEERLSREKTSTREASWRIGGDKRDDGGRQNEDESSKPKWTPSSAKGGWRERVKAKEDSWKKTEPEGDSEPQQEPSMPHQSDNRGEQNPKEDDEVDTWRPGQGGSSRFASRDIRQEPGYDPNKPAEPRRERDSQDDRSFGREDRGFGRDDYNNPDRDGRGGYSGGGFERDRDGGREREGGFGRDRDGGGFRERDGGGGRDSGVAWRDDRGSGRDRDDRRDFGSQRFDRDGDRGGRDFGRRDDDRRRDFDDRQRDFRRRDDDRPRDFERRDVDRPSDFRRRDDGPRDNDRSRDFGRRDDDRPRDLGRRDDHDAGPRNWRDRDSEREERDGGGRPAWRPTSGDDRGGDSWRSKELGAPSKPSGQKDESSGWTTVRH